MIYTHNHNNTLVLCVLFVRLIKDTYRTRVRISVFYTFPFDTLRLLYYPEILTYYKYSIY